MVRQFTQDEINEINTLLGEIEILRNGYQTKQTILDDLTQRKLRMTVFYHKINKLHGQSLLELTAEDIVERANFFLDFKEFGHQRYIIDLFAKNRDQVIREIIEVKVQSIRTERNEINTQILTKRSRIRKLQDLLVYG